MHRTPPKNRSASLPRSTDIEPGTTREPSRRLQARPAEFGPLPLSRSVKTQTLALELPQDTSSAQTQTKGSMLTAQGQTSLVLQHPREPPSFHGAPHEDPEDWLEEFERVATMNRWDEEEKLRHVYFSLQDSARTWFANRESTLTTWELFKAELRKTFTNVLRKERAELLLQTRVQHPNETAIVFVEEMTRLFQRADPTMSEDKKLRILMRGIKEQLFAVLVRNPPKSVNEFAAEAASIEKTLSERARQYERQPQVLGASSANSAALCNDSLRETIRAVVQEELSKLIAPALQPQLTSLTDVIREEVQQALGTQGPVQPTPPPPTISYATAAKSPPRPLHVHREVHPPSRQESSSRQTIMQSPTPRKSNVWRTPDHRPLCYHCGEAGHLYRFCRYRQLGLRGFDIDAPRPVPGQRPRDIEDYLADTSRSYRSPSPRRFNSPGRRPYAENGRNRSLSPRGGN